MQSTKPGRLFQNLAIAGKRIEEYRVEQAYQSRTWCIAFNVANSSSLLLVGTCYTFEPLRHVLSRKQVLE